MEGGRVTDRWKGCAGCMNRWGLGRQKNHGFLGDGCLMEGELDGGRRETTSKCSLGYKPWPRPDLTLVPNTDTQSSHTTRIM